MKPVLQIPVHALSPVAHAPGRQEKGYMFRASLAYVVNPNSGEKKSRKFHVFVLLLPFPEAAFKGHRVTHQSGTFPQTLYSLIADHFPTHYHRNVVF